MAKKGIIYKMFNVYFSANKNIMIDGQLLADQMIVDSNDNEGGC